MVHYWRVFTGAIERIFTIQVCDNQSFGFSPNISAKVHPTLRSKNPQHPQHVAANSSQSILRALHHFWSRHSHQRMAASSFELIQPDDFRLYLSVISFLAKTNKHRVSPFLVSSYCSKNNLMKSPQLHGCSLRCSPASMTAEKNHRVLMKAGGVVGTGRRRVGIRCLVVGQPADVVPS